MAELESLAQSYKTSNQPSDLSNQSIQKLTLLGSLRNSLETNINVINRSQRLFDITEHVLIQDVPEKSHK